MCVTGIPATAQAAVPATSKAAATATAKVAAPATAKAPPPPSPDPVPLRAQTPKLAPTTDAPNGAAAAAQSNNGAPSKSGTTQPQSTAKPAPATNMPPAAPQIDKYSQVSELEKLMFGVAQPNIPVEYRLDRLESEVFHTTNPHWSIKQRIDQLNDTLVGNGTPGASPSYPKPPARFVDPAAADPQYGMQSAPYGDPNQQQYGADGTPFGNEQTPPPAVSNEANYMPAPSGDLNSREFQKELSAAQGQQYALELINDSRAQQGLQALELDETAAKVASEIVADNCKRNTVAHLNFDGDNPDVRYTKLGGTDCLVETLAAAKTDRKPVINKSLIYGIIKDMTSHQDDRDALFGSHATHGAFSLDWSSGHDKTIACAEIVTKQASVAATPREVHVGEKLEVKGVMTGPYKFSRISVAWEGAMPASDDGEQQDEALPYFPPLDYEAFAKHTERDWQRGKQVLQLVGITAAVAAGVFFPPAALAAPLIAASAPGMNRPKALSEIPIRGGVKVDGAAFSHKFPISKDDKEGIYYVTIWANSDADPMPFAISRRAIVAKPSADGKKNDLRVSERSDDGNQSSPPAQANKAQGANDVEKDENN